MTSGALVSWGYILNSTHAKPKRQAESLRRKKSQAFECLKASYDVTMSELLLGKKESQAIKLDQHKNDSSIILMAWMAWKPLPCY